jgi:hypothetical protein
LNGVAAHEKAPRQRVPTRPIAQSISLFLIYFIRRSPPRDTDIYPSSRIVAQEGPTAISRFCCSRPITSACFFKGTKGGLDERTGHEK